MNKKSTFGIIATSLVWFSAAANMPAVAAVVNAEWINGSGNYSDVSKWNIPVAPCNEGSTTFSVNIPVGSGTVSDDVLDCTVDTLNLADNVTLKILAGNSYTVLGQADIDGIVHGMGGDFTALTATFTGSSARAYAEMGSAVTIGAPAYSSAGSWPTSTLFSSTNAGSLLDLSSMQSLNAGFNDGSTGVRAHYITASDAGVIDLSGVGLLTAPARTEDRVDFSASGTSVIDLQSLSTIDGIGQVWFSVSDTAVINLASLSTFGGWLTKFTVSSGALQDLPALETVANGIFEVSGGSTLSATGPMWVYSSAGLWPTSTLFSSTNAGSLLDLSSMQSLNAGFNDGSTGVRVHSITASDAGVINLSGVESLTAPARIEDWLGLYVSDTAVIDLASLSIIGGVGPTRFVVSGGATQDLPALVTVANGIFEVSGGSTLSAAGPLWVYSSAGLWPTSTLFSSTNAGSLLDLSSMQSLNAGFNDGSTGVRAHYITASDAGVIDLSGVGLLTAPARTEDRVDFSASGTSVIDLQSLSTIDGVGQVWFSVSDTAVINLASLSTFGGWLTKFTVSSGALQDLPALETVANGIFEVSGGSTLSATGPMWVYSSAGLWPTSTLFSSTNAGSLLDLSSMQSLNAGFNDGSTGVRVHSITASDAGVIIMSEVGLLTTPARGEDRVEMNASSNASIDLGSLTSISGAGDIVINVSTSATIKLASLKNINMGVGGVASFNISTGANVQIGDLSGVTAATTINLNDADTSIIAVDSLLLTPSTSLISVADAMISIANDYIFDQTDENKIDLESAVVKFDGVAPQLVEAGGFDIGTLTPVGPNFGFGQMVVGTDSQATTVYLRDGVNNGNGHDLFGPGVEALYLLGLPYDPDNLGKIVNGLRILGGSTLVLNGIPLYVMQDGYLQDVRDWFPMGQRVIAYALNNSNGYIDLGTSPDTDADVDGFLDTNDNCILVANPTQCDADADGYGNHCDADFNNDLNVNNFDVGLFKDGLGTTNTVTDLNCDGITNNFDVGLFKVRLGLPPGPSALAP